jgi:hypothetical protein
MRPPSSAVSRSLTLEDVVLVWAFVEAMVEVFMAITSGWVERCSYIKNPEFTDK